MKLALPTVAVLLLSFLLFTAQCYNIGFICRKTECDFDTGLSRPNLWVETQFEQMQLLAAEFGINAYWIPLDYTNTSTENVFAAVQNFFVPLNIGHVVASGNVLGFIEVLGQIDTQMFFTLADAPRSQPGAKIANRTESFRFREDQAGFLAGALAGAHTKTGRVGCVAGPAAVPLKNFGNGFLNGARHACPSCILDLAYLPSFTDGVMGIRVATEIVNRGADVIFAAAGSAGSIAIYELASTTWVIGVDADEFDTTFSGDVDSKTIHLLGSAIKRTDLAVARSLRNALTGNFRGGDSIMGVSEGFIGLSDCHASCPSISQRTRDLVAHITRELTRNSSLTGISPFTGDMIFEADNAFLRPEPNLVFSGVDGAPQKDAQIVPMGLIELLMDSDWSTIKWLMHTSRTTSYFSIDTELSDPLPPQRWDYTAKSLVLHDGTQLAVVFGGAETPTKLADNDIWTLQFTPCVLQNLCWVFPFWKKVLSGTDGPSPRAQPWSAAIGSKFFLIGGMDSHGKILSDIWLIDFDSTSETHADWSNLGTIHKGGRIFAVAVWRSADGYHNLTATDYLVVICSHDGHVHVQFYHIESHRWFSKTLSDFSPTQYWISNPCLVPWGPRLLVVGGGSSKGPIAVYSPELNTLAFDEDRRGNDVVPSGNLTCSVVEQDGEFALVSDVQSPPAAHNHFHVLPCNALSSDSIVLLYRAAILCQESVGLALSSNATVCEYCNTEIVRQECLPCSDCQESKAWLNTRHTIGLIVFIIGVIIGIVLWKTVTRLGPRSKRNAPLKVPCALALVNIPRIVRHWKLSPRSTAESLKMFRKIVGDVIGKHSCYEVSQIGDAHFIAANTPEQVLRMMVELFHTLRRAQWPDKAALEPSGAIHVGSPNVVHTHDGYNYKGLPADVTIMLGRRADRQEICLSTAALAAIQSDVSDLEFIAQREEYVGDTAYAYSVQLSYQIFHVLPEDDFEGNTFELMRSGAASIPRNIAATASETSGFVSVSLFAHAEVQRHLFVQAGLMTVAECHAALNVVYDALNSLFSTLDTEEQEEVLRRVMLRIRAGDAASRATQFIGDSVAQAAYFVLQLIDPLEFRIIVEEFARKVQR